MYEDIDKGTYDKIRKAEQRSKVTEFVFESLLKRCGYKVWDSTRQEQLLHIDRWLLDVQEHIFPKTKKVSVDVKDERKNWFDAKPNKGWKECAPMGFKEPCHSMEYMKFSETYKAWSIGNHLPDFFAFESSKYGTEKYLGKDKNGNDKKYEIGTSFILVMGKDLKKAAIDHKEKMLKEHGIRMVVDALCSSDFRHSDRVLKYGEPLFQVSSKGKNCYCFVNREFIEKISFCTLNLKEVS